MIMKNIIAFLTIIFLSISGSFWSFASYPNGWNYINSDWYFMEDSVPKTGWLKDGGYWYYLLNNGTMALGDCRINDRIYSFNISDSDYIPYGALLDENTVSVKCFDINGHEYLILQNPACDKEKVLFMLHGLGGGKTDYLSYAAELADCGYFVILPDAYSHGSDKTVSDYPDIIKNTTVFMDAILDTYQINNSSEISILGVSMGGMIGSYYAAHGSRIVDRLALLISTPDFSELTDDIFYKIYSVGNSIGLADYNSVKQKLLQLSPCNVIEDSHTDVMIIQGKNDPIIPNYFSDVNHIHIIHGEYGGHVAPNEYFQIALSWLQKK